MKPVRTFVLCRAITSLYGAQLPIMSFEAISKPWIVGPGVAQSTSISTSTTSSIDIKKPCSTYSDSIRNVFFNCHLMRQLTLKAGTCSQGMLYFRLHPKHDDVIANPFFANKVKQQVHNDTHRAIHRVTSCRKTQIGWLFLKPARGYGITQISCNSQSWNRRNKRQGKLHVCWLFKKNQIILFLKNETILIQGI